MWRNEALVDQWRKCLEEGLASTDLAVGRIEPFLSDVLAQGEMYVADYTSKMLVRDPAGRPVAVALCAQSTGSEMVARGMQRAREAKERLGPDLGTPILDPIWEGELDGNSCAVLPWCRPLSKNRIIQRIQHWRLRPVMLNWIREVTRVTVEIPDHSTVQDRFIAPLDMFSTHGGIPESIVREARQTLDRLHEGRWQPRHVLMHCDLSSENTLIDSRGVTGHGGRPWHERIVIIDWPGSTTSGYPIIDLMRIDHCYRVKPRQLRQELERHCGFLDCDTSEAKSHVMVGMGYVLQNLEHFPLPNFIRDVEARLARFEQVLG